MRRLASIVALLCLVGCDSVTTDLDRKPCDGDVCLIGYICNPVQNICVEELELGCSDDGGVCPDLTGTGAACPGEDLVLPCTNAAGDCSLGCRVCGADLRWTECVDPACGKPCDRSTPDCVEGACVCNESSCPEETTCRDGACATPVCGDGIKDEAETCDGTQLGDESCAGLEFLSGTLACNDECRFDTSGCTNCGDGDLDAGEQCDGTAHGGRNCSSFSFDGGFLVCNADCTFDTTNCTGCGDSLIEGAEQCEPGDLDGEDCISLGFLKGTLGCAADCSFDLAACSNCGDGALDGDEACDGSDFGATTCQTLGFDDGTLACNADCTSTLR